MNYTRTISNVVVGHKKVASCPELFITPPTPKLANPTAHTCPNVAVNVLKKIQFLDANPFGNEFRDFSSNPELPIWNLNSTRIYDNQVIQIDEL